MRWVALAVKILRLLNQIMQSVTLRIASELSHQFVTDAREIVKDQTMPTVSKGSDSNPPTYRFPMPWLQRLRGWPDRSHWPPPYFVIY